MASRLIAGVITLGLLGSVSCSLHLVGGGKRPYDIAVSCEGYGWPGFGFDLSVGDSMQCNTVYASTGSDAVVLFQVPAHLVTWTSSDSSIATVSSTGRVVARRLGRVLVRGFALPPDSADERARLHWAALPRTVQYNAGTSPFYVWPVVARFAWEPDSSVVQVGDTRMLAAVARDSSGEMVGSWGGGYSVDPQRATVGHTDTRHPGPGVRFIATGPGRVQFYARFGSRADTAVVIVR